MSYKPRVLAVADGGTGQSTLAAFGVLVGNGTSGISTLASGSAGQILQSGGAASNPVYSTATYPATAGTAGTILRSDGTNWGSTFASYPSTIAQNQILYASGNNVISSTPALNTNGQLLIASTTGPPIPATLTAGAGVSITNAANSITLAVSGGGFTWTDITGATQTLVVANGYVTNRGGGVTYTLPASATEGDRINIAGKAGLWVIAQNANQQINVGSSSTTVGVTGSVTATNAGDCIELLCTTSGSSTIWRAISLVGNLTIA